jgi:hypothetical protein
MKSLKEFGAIGDGLADDTQAVMQAVNSFLPIEAPPGVYRITSPIKSYAPSVHIEGSGGSTIFLFDSCDGFDFALPETEYYATSNDGLVLKNFHVKTNTNSYTGMVIRCDEGGGSSNIPSMVDGVTFSGITPQTSYWSTALVYRGVGRTSTRSVRVHGPIFLDRGSVGIEYDGNLGFASTEHSLSDIKVVGCGTGVLATGWIEGITADKCHIVAAYKGVVAHLDNKPQFNINNSHINAWEYGIYFDEVTQSSISNNLIYIDSTRTTPEHKGIFSYGPEEISRDVIITNNTLYHMGDPLQQGQGMDVYGSGYIIANNIIKLFDTGIYSSISDSIVKDNLYIFCKEQINDGLV